MGPLSAVSDADIGGIRIGSADLVKFSPDRPSQDVPKRRFSLALSLVALILELAGVRGLLRFQPGGVKSYGNKIICVRAESARSDARRCTAGGCSRTSSGVRGAVPVLHESRRAPRGARVPRVRDGPAAASVEGLRHRWCHAHVGSGRHRSAAQPGFLNTRWSPIVLCTTDDGATARRRSNVGSSFESSRRWIRVGVAGPDRDHRPQQGEEGQCGGHGDDCLGPARDHVEDEEQHAGARECEQYQPGPGAVVRGLDQPVAHALTEEDPVERHRRDHEARGEHRSAEDRQVRRHLDPVEIMEPVRERDRQQESGEDLHSRLGYP